MSPYNHITISSYHHVTISSYHHFTISPYHHIIISSYHHIIISSYHHITISPYHHLRELCSTTVIRKACARFPGFVLRAVTPFPVHPVACSKLGPFFEKS